MRKRLSIEQRKALGLHRRIREAREAAGVVPAQLAAWLGVHVSVLSRMESGESGISAERVKEIAQLLHVTVASLYGETSTTVEEPPAP